MIEGHRIETIVRERYAASAKSPEARLCCPVNYESEYLEVIPSEVIERDYGCGDRFTKRAPYREFFEFVEPIIDVPLVEAKPFDCSRTSLRHPKKTKGEDYDVTTEANNTCCDGGSCC